MHVVRVYVCVECVSVHAKQRMVCSPLDKQTIMSCPVRQHDLSCPTGQRLTRDKARPTGQRLTRDEARVHQACPCVEEVPAHFSMQH